MPRVRLELPIPHGSQQTIIEGAKRFNAICCGRRWGKTELGTDRMIHPALHGKPCAWFAPSYKFLNPVWREMQIRLRKLIARVNQQERRMELITGGSLEFWTLDSPDAGRGRAYARVLIDEAAMIPHLMEAWEQSIRAQLTDYQGDAWFLSTPKGTANDFHKLFMRGRDGGDWSSWQMPTSTNPYIAPTEIEAARGDLTDLAFAQEYLAQFVSWEGAVFRRILDCIFTPPTHAQATSIGVDWGRTNDYTVFTALSHRGEMLAMDRFRGMEYALQRQRLKAFWEHWGSSAYIFAETNSMGGPVVEQLQRDGLPVQGFNTTQASKAAIIEALTLAFERGVIRIPNDPVLIGELQAFEARPLPGGRNRYCAPEGVHDDTVMALAIAWQGLALWESQQQRQRTVYRPFEISPV